MMSDSPATRRPTIRGTHRQQLAQTARSLLSQLRDLGSRRRPTKALLILRLWPSVTRCMRR